MSGPKSILFNTDPLAVLLAANGIRAAQAIQDGYAHAAALRQLHRNNLDEIQVSQEAAAQQRRQALLAECANVEVAFEQLQTLAGKLGAGEKLQAIRPPAPASDDEPAIVAYVNALHDLTNRLRTVLLTEAARQTEQFADMPELNIQTATQQTIQTIQSASSPSAQAFIQRQLARIAHLGPIPDTIHAIALELEQTAQGERAELLSTELRAQIQTLLEHRQQQDVQEATSLVVRQSLQDLGYQVEDIADTLFVEGGVVHFRRRDWGNYMVRMRVDAKQGAANFNVIRAVTERDNERSVLDHLAEDRWCTEFPALLQALRARGVHMRVTRHVEAGELPVQLVEARKLPAFSNEERSLNSIKPMMQRLP